MWHGGDYNPEQWPREVVAEDMRLMDLARVNVATVGVFSWVSLEPEEGVYTFDWLDEVMDTLHKNGKFAVMATPSAAPPAWLSQMYPQILRVGPDRVQMLHGNRVNYDWSSPIYRQKVREMATILAERYGNHPALLMWHVSNEYGGMSYSEASRQAFIQWLKNKFDGSLDALNAAYWTRFWGHTFTEWDQIEIPGAPYGETAIQGLTLDWNRFTTDEIVIGENELGFDGIYQAHTFCERIQVTSAEVLAQYGNVWYMFEPAVTLNKFGEGSAIYVASRNDEQFTSNLLNHLLEKLQIEPATPFHLPDGVSATKRVSESGTYLFLLNTTEHSHWIALPEEYIEALNNQPVSGSLEIGPFGVAVLTVV